MSKDSKTVTTGLKDSDVVNHGYGTGVKEATVDLKQATITVPESAIVREDAPTLEAKDAVEDNSFGARALRAGVGRIDVRGIDWTFVGARVPKMETPDGFPISTANTSFTPLSEVRFDPSVRVFVGGKYFFPTDATSWEGVEGLVPKK